MNNLKWMFLAVLFIGSFLNTGAQVFEPDGYVNNGGGAIASSGDFISSIGEPVVGLLASDAYNCLQGFVYKIFADDIKTGIGDNIVSLSLKISLYPNPVSELLYVDCEAKYYDYLQYSIFSQNGALMKNGILDGNRTTIDVSGFSSATYVFVLTNTSYGIATNRIKFVKI